jgi:hypothetical protein
MVEGEGGCGRYACEVSVGDRFIARVEDGVNKEEVKTKAAEAAVQILRAERNDTKAEKK